MTVIAANTDHSLLLRLSDSIGQLKQRVIQEMPSVTETLAADSNISVQLGYDGKVPGNESRSCMQEGLKHHSHMFRLFENGSNRSTIVELMPPFKPCMQPRFYAPSCLHLMSAS